MAPLEDIAVAVGLGMDAMSVSMAVGVRWHTPRHRFRLSWHMGLFQFLMPIIGYLVGMRIAGLLAQVGTYVATALVFAIGAKMLYEAVKHRHLGVEDGESAARTRKDPTKGFSLIALSVATSLDALVVGFSLGLKGTGIWVASVVIGGVAAGMSLAGVAVGKRFGRRFGQTAEIIGALVLMGLAVSFLWL